MTGGHYLVRSVLAARASYIGSARIEASGWTWSRRSSGSPRYPKCACRAREDGVMQAPAPTRRADCRPKQPSPRFWSPNMPITRRSTGRPRSMPARASFSIDRHWRTGLAMLSSFCARCMSVFSRCFTRYPSCSRTRRRCRCSIPVEGAPRPANSGPPALRRPRSARHRLCPCTRPQGRAAVHLAGFKGVLQVDGYNAYPCGPTDRCSSSPE